MTSSILKCGKCGKYTLEKYCGCGGDCLSTRPAKFSLEDKYSKYRLDYKKKTKSI